MTNTSTTNGSPARPKKTGRKTAVGEYKHKRTGIDIALGLLTPIVGQEFLDKYNLRDPLNRTLKYGVKTGFSVAGATSRQFKRVQVLLGGPTRLKASGKDYFDLTPYDDQKLIVETVDQFAQEILRPAAAEAHEALFRNRNVGRAVREDVDDCTRARAAILSRDCTREDFERVDVLRVHDFGEVGAGRERQRGAVDFIRYAVEAVRDGLVVRESHDTGHRGDDFIEAVIRRQGIHLRARDDVNRDRRSRCTGMCGCRRAA